MTKTIHNLDVQHLVHIIHQYCREILNESDYRPGTFGIFQQSRLAEYLKKIRSLVNWICSQPEIDLKHRWSVEMNIPDEVAVAIPASEHIVFIAKTFIEMNRGLLESHSAWQATGLTRHDRERLESLVDRIESYVATHVQVLDESN